MHSNNIVLLRGRVTSEPRRRQLPSGSAVTNLELTTELADRRISVPVVVHDREVTVEAGSEVVVTGYIQRRYFRAGATTQSRTEVVADRIVSASSARSVSALVKRVETDLRSVV